MSETAASCVQTYQHDDIRQFGAFGAVNQQSGVQHRSNCRTQMLALWSLLLCINYCTLCFMQQRIYMSWLKHPPCGCQGAIVLVLLLLLLPAAPCLLQDVQCTGDRQIVAMVWMHIEQLLSCGPNIEAAIR